MIPSYFLQIDAIPLDINGKINKNVLPSPIQSIKQNIKKPTNDIEKKIRSAWANLLQINEKDISIEASFFDIGGDSLLVLLLKENLINLFNKSALKSEDIITIEQILKTPTIKELAEYLT